jgi:hypothetical protein
LASSTNENGCNIPPIKGATLDKPSEMMAFSLSISELDELHLLDFYQEDFLKRCNLISLMYT